jgi:hypothetical protein
VSGCFRNRRPDIPEYAEERGNGLVVFIDELDRCKPSYAIRLLERIKHYFTNDSVTFVFSVNLDELQHTVKQHYGNGFNAYKYLDRFFDLRVSLPPPNLDSYYQMLGLDKGSYIYEAVCKEVIKVHRFELREIARFYQLARVAAYKPTHDSRYVFGFPEEKATQLCLFCVAPIMLGLKISDIERYNSFIYGKDSSPLIEVLGSGELAQNLCASLLSPGQSYGPMQPGIVKVKIEDKLNEVYNALFAQDYTKGTYEKAIGGISFTRETRDILMRVDSLLSQYADFHI